MDDKAKIKINLNEGLFEIEGTEDFIEKNAVMIKDFFDKSNQKVIKPAPENKTNDSNNILDQTFDDYLDNFKEELQNVDSLLLACYYLENNSEGKSFIKKDANDLLKKHGIKLSNPTVSYKGLAGCIYDNNGGTFKVSKEGRKRIETLKKQ